MKTLPEVFDLSTFCRMVDLQRQDARTYLSRWSHRGLVERSGPRSGIYLNLVVAPGPPARLAIQALVMAYPSAVLVGPSVLHSAGWITQIPQEMTVAVMSRPSYAKLNGFNVSGRPRAWYVAVHDGLSTDEGLATFGLPSLTPALALADMFARDAWRPDPDDLYLDDADPTEVAEAFERLGVKMPDLPLPTDGSPRP